MDDLTQITDATDSDQAAGNLIRQAIVGESGTPDESGEVKTSLGGPEESVETEVQDDTQLVAEDDSQVDDEVDEDVEETDEVDEDTPAEDDEDEDQPSDEEGIPLPKSLRSINPEELKTEEGRHMYQLAEQARKDMEKHFHENNRKAVAVTRGVEPHQEQLQALQQALGDQDPKLEEYIGAGLELLFVVHSEDGRRKLYQNLAQTYGGTEQQQAAPAYEDEPLPEVQELKNQFTTEVSQLKSQLQQFEQKATMQQQREAFDQERTRVEKLSEFGDFSDAHWRRVVNDWVNDPQERDYETVAREFRDLIVSDRDTRAKKRLAKKTQQTPVGAGAQGAAAEAAPKLPATEKEADQQALSILQGLRN